MSSSSAAGTGGAGEGGSTSTGGGGGSGGSAGSGGAPPIATCASGTLESYLGTSCSQGNTVYHWSTYSCTSMPASLCAALGADGKNFFMRMDPNGPHTILVGGTSALSVKAGENLDVVITGSVYGSFLNLDWPHFNGPMEQGKTGQTGDGVEENITTVGCAPTGDCLDANNGVSDIRCDAMSPAANCNDQNNDAVYNQYKAKYNPAPPGSPYSLTIEISLVGNTGTATLHSIGTHM